jgi:hypothetical protein
MAKKSIADLERYRDLLVIKKELVQDSITDHMFLLEGGEFDFPSEVEMMEVLSSKIDLLNYEIDVALLSNSIKIDGEEMSLRQAVDSLKNIEDRLSFFNSYRDEYLEARRQAIEASAMTPFLLSTSLESIEEIIQFAHEDIYSLNEKIRKDKERVKLTVDMKDFVIENLIVATGEVTTS